MSLLEELLKRTPPEDQDCLRAFAAGWDGFVNRYGGMLYMRGFRDLRDGFEAEWHNYRLTGNPAPVLAPIKSCSTNPE